MDGNPHRDNPQLFARANIRSAPLRQILKEKIRTAVRILLREYPWKFFKTFYAPQSAAAKARLTQAWCCFGMRDGEAPNEYIARGNVLRSQLDTHGVIHTSDSDVNQHFARNLTPDYSVQKSVRLAKDEFS